MAPRIGHTDRKCCRNFVATPFGAASSGKNEWRFVGGPMPADGTLAARSPAKIRHVPLQEQLHKIYQISRAWGIGRMARSMVSNGSFATGWREQQVRPCPLRPESGSKLGVLAAALTCLAGWWWWRAQRHFLAAPIERWHGADHERL